MKKLITLIVLSFAPTLLQAALLVDTEADFSLSGEGVNGIQYGYYDSGGLTGTFDTTGMVADTTQQRWEGTDGDQTPIFDPTVSHEGVDNSGNVLVSAVRRFTDGMGSSPGYSGMVDISFQAWKVPFGSIGNGADIFIDLNGVNIYYARVPNQGTQQNPYISSDIFVDLNPGDTVDFGVTDLTGNGISDVTGFTAQINTVSAPEPKECGFAGGLLCLAGAAEHLFRSKRRSGLRS